MEQSINNTTYGLIESYLESLNCARSLTVWLMFLYKEHDQLVALTLDPLDYNDPHAFRDSYLATKFLSKATFLSTSVDTREAALKGFLKCEETCKEINVSGFGSRLLGGRFEWLHRATQQTIQTILGDFPASELFDSANWGPGVTLKVKGDTSATNKFRLEGGITRNLHCLVSGLFSTAYPHWSPKFVIEEGNKIVTVPKNSKTDRTIAIEPGLNLWFQKGVGLMIRRRLSRYGLNLNSQERNQQLARLSSLNGKLATVDFSAASDSISHRTVWELLPPDWYDVTNLLRSRIGLIGSNKLIYEKFSSMGNGFTFELESLLFYAMALAVVDYLHLSRREVSVYGDDVILPVEAFDLYSRLCEAYGFTVNRTKSYSSSQFRESCGSHYFKGVDCKPYYLVDIVRRETEIYIAANAIRRISKLSYGCDKRFFAVHQALVDKVPLKKRCYIPLGFGDGGFVENFDLASPSRPRKGPFSTWEGYLTKALLSVPIGYDSHDEALLLARLKGCSAGDHRKTDGDRVLPNFLSSLRRLSDRSLGNETFLRGKVRYVRKRMFVPRWVDLGPWL